MTQMTRFRRSTLASALALFSLLLAGGNVAAQGSPHVSGVRDTGPMIDLATSLLDIRSELDPYADEFIVSGTVLEGPFAGMIVRGRTGRATGGRISDRAHLYALIDTNDATVLITAIVANGAAGTTRLTAQMDVRSLSAEAVGALWPHVVAALWPTPTTDRVQR